MIIKYIVFIQQVYKKLLSVTLSYSQLLSVTRNMATTIAMLVKERINNMPDDIDNIKDVEAYFKQVTKEEKHKLKAEEAAKKKNKKKEDSDENDKPKKAVRSYQIFAKDFRIKIKEESPDLSAAEVRAKLSEEWKKHKEALLVVTATETSES